MAIFACSPSLFVPYTRHCASLNLRLLSPFVPLPPLSAIILISSFVNLTLLSCSFFLPKAYGSGKIRGAERNLPDFSILPDRSNSLLNFGNFRKAKNVRNIALFSCLFYYFLHISCFQLIFPTFSYLTVFLYLHGISYR
jgi:hypothetical protein